MTEKEYRDKVYAEAKAMNPNEEALCAFLKSLGAHEHDYGTIVYACAAAMKAAFRVVNASPQGGITGFQAGCLMWEMVSEFGMFSEGPLKIMDFDRLRFPQYDDDFAVRLSPASAKVLSERAAKQLGEPAHPAVRERNEQIARGEFPPFVTVADE